MLPSGSCGYAVQKSLTPQVYDFIQSIQQPAQVGSQASQPHAAVAREERMIPDIVFQIEELERQLIQLSSKGAQSVHAADMSCWMQMRCCCWKADYSDNFNRTIPLMSLIHHIMLMQEASILCAMLNGAQIGTGDLHPRPRMLLYRSILLGHGLARRKLPSLDGLQSTYVM